MENLKYCIENGVGTISLNRPKQKSTFTIQLQGIHLPGHVPEPVRKF